MSKVPRRRGYGLLLVVLAVGGCGGDDAESTDTGATDTGAGDPVEITIDISETGVDAPERPRIELGSEVSLVFSSFEQGDAHLHGYDVWSPVGPDAENRIDFVADAPGIFLVELEENLLYLTELVVQ